MTAAAPDPLLGALLAGRYHVVKKLGEGGMGAVYEATHVAGGPYAVKVIHAEVAARMATAVARFLQEARTASTVNSHNVVPVVDAGTDPNLGVPFLVMPLLHGRDVEHLVDEVGPIDPTTAVRIAIQAARGLGTAHASGVVHRDVKPANLFLDAGPDGSVLVKVCDFGIAKVLDPSHDGLLTKTGSMLGSPLYLSPEQAKSAKHVDARTDVWSLGVTLYYMLTGEAPHSDSQSMAELIVAISTKAPTPIQEISPWVDPALVAIVDSTLTRDLDRRCPSMHALFNALLPHAGGAEHLTPAMLAGPSEELKRRVAARASATSLPTIEAPPTDPGKGLLGSTLAGKYRLTSLLGKGGMGAVYEAVDASGQRLAVKVMFGATLASADARKRFVREARASASLSSPNVVRVVDADTDPANGTPFIVMELLSGTDLQGLIAKVGAIDEALGVRLLLQACRGLAVAHAAGVIHRDIKPANLFLDTSPTGEVSVKLCDFGIAKTTSTEAIDATSSQLTKTGGMLGSPVYMSPEQAKNAKHVDARTDVWSLSMTMYEALAGRNPWERCTTIGELILAICTEDVPPLADAAPWLDQRLADAIQRGLRREASERWSSVDELYAAIAPLATSGDRITREMLVGLMPERRSIASPRLPAPRSTIVSNAASTAGGAIAVTLATPPPRRSPVLAIAGVVAALAIAGSVGAWKLLGTKAEATALGASASAESAAPPALSASAAPVASASAPAPAEPAKTKMRIAVTPKAATVTVDGEPRALEDGDLVLEGAPGDAFKVVATTPTGTLAQTIHLQRDGTADPASIHVPALPGLPAHAGKKPGGRLTPKLKTDWR